MMNVFIDKLERLMGEFKNEPVNQNEDKQKNNALLLLNATGIRPLRNVSI